MAGTGRLGQMAPQADWVKARGGVAALKAGPKTSGLATQMWTLAPVAEVIERDWGPALLNGQTWGSPMGTANHLTSIQTGTTSIRTGRKSAEGTSRTWTADGRRTEF